jgi:hypothetical protein
VARTDLSTELSRRVSYTGNRLSSIDEERDVSYRENRIGSASSERVLKFLLFI